MNDIHVTPARDPQSGEPYKTAHPSKKREYIGEDGAWVPNDLFTMRRIKDGGWLKTEPQPERDDD